MACTQLVLVHATCHWLQIRQAVSENYMLRLQHIKAYKVLTHACSIIYHQSTSGSPSLCMALLHIHNLQICSGYNLVRRSANSLLASTRALQSLQLCCCCRCASCDPPKQQGVGGVHPLHRARLSKSQSQSTQQPCLGAEANALLYSSCIRCWSWCARRVVCCCAASSSSRRTSSSSSTSFCCCSSNSSLLALLLQLIQLFQIFRPQLNACRSSAQHMQGLLVSNEHGGAHTHVCSVIPCPMNIFK
jgi:hypothetical protein